MHRYHLPGIYYQLCGLLIILSCFATYIQCQNEPALECPNGMMGGNCTLECHCEAVEMCTAGGCSDYQCLKGWTSAPECQVECDEGKFDSNCAGTCHCPAGDTCDKVNGVCSSNQCHQEWTGGSCQIRLPKLIDSPTLMNLTCTDLNVAWSAWVYEQDSGEPPVGSYTLEQRINETEWTVVEDITNIVGIVEFVVNVINIDYYDVIEFRVFTHREDSGKKVTGLPSPASTPVQLLDYCRVPEAVSDVNFNMDLPDVATVTWTRITEIDGELLGYNLTYQKLGNGDCDTESEPITFVLLDPEVESMVISDLQRWSRYQVTIRAINQAGEGIAAMDSLTTPETAPSGSVTDLVYRNVSTTGVTLMWNEVECSGRGGRLVTYEVIVKRNDSGAEVNRINTIYTEYTINFLEDGTSYSVYIQYINKRGKGPPSQGIVFTTLHKATTLTSTYSTTNRPISSTSPTTAVPSSEPTTKTQMSTTTAPSVPEHIPFFTVRSEESDSLLVKWSKPDDDGGSPLLGYILTYQKLSTGDCDFLSGTVTSVTLGSNMTQWTAGSFAAWSLYNVTLQASNAIGYSQTVHTTVTTPQTVSTGVVRGVDIQILDIWKMRFVWDELLCKDRGGELLYYEVMLYDVISGKVASRKNTTEEAVEMSNLQPFTLYDFQVRFVNAKGPGPFTSKIRSKTREYVPSEPQDVAAVNVTSTSIQVTWQTPSLANGVIREYRIIFRSKSERSFSQKASEGNVANITQLTPFTKYYIQIQARTGSRVDDGWGNRSDVISQVTLDGKPSKPIKVQRSFRNQSCIGITWQPPITPKGVITLYEIDYSVIAIQSSSDTDQRSLRITVPSNQSHSTHCSLLPAAKYRFEVRAQTRSTSGTPTVLELWTEVGTPEIPPRPLVIMIGSSSITINIAPVVLMNGPVSGYFIVVAEIADRKKRELPDPVEVIPLPGYTAAQIWREDIRETREFIVGDNQTYNGYFNRVLKSEINYNIYFVVASSLDGVTKMSFSQISSPIHTLAIVDNTVLIIGIVAALAVLVLLIIIIIIIIFCLKRRKSKANEAQEKRDIWLSYSNAAYYNTAPQTLHGNWSDIYELDEPRYPTIDRTTYNVDDLNVCDMLHQQPTVSIHEEYKHLPRGKKFAWTVGERVQNANRNRFDHILAYDHSRVKIPPVNGSDYINANFIDGYSKDKRYISAQSPYNDLTLTELWLMIFTHDIRDVIFPSNLVEDGLTKSLKYWPDTGSGMYGRIHVKHLETEEYANFVHRVFDITDETDVAKRVHQYQFTTWPDHGVPEDPIPFLEFVMKVKGSYHSSTSPVLVHCGTGVSRSAIFIAIDSLLDHAKYDNSMNVFKFCNLMRKKRTLMVRTFKQYLFIYDTLFEALITTGHVVGDNLKVNYRMLSNKNPSTDKSYFREQFELLETYTPKLESSKCRQALLETNVSKNRFGTTIVPPDRHIPILKAPTGGDRLNYINALYLDTYVERDGYIVTQTPLATTVADFWRLIYDCKVSAIVMLNSTEFKEETCAQYWPTHRGIERWDPFEVEFISENEKPHMIIRDLILTSLEKPSGKPREIRQFQFQSWKMYEKVPWHREGFVELMEAVESWREETYSSERPVVVHCMDGASQSGLYCACAILCEKIQFDQEVDVFHTIKHMKLKRPHFISSLEQYKFCFKVLWDILNTRFITKDQQQLVNGHVHETLTYFDNLNED